MSEYTTDKSTWNGWSWRLIGLTVLGIAVLQLVLKVALKYPLFASLPLAVLVISYVVIPRAKERKLANAIVGVVAMFIVSAALAFIFEPAIVQTAVKNHAVPGFLINNLLFPLLLGLVLAYGYLRINQWSEKKKADMEQKRREKMSVDKPAPQRRVHSKKKRKKR